MVNLLGVSESFIWSDKLLDRNEFIDELNNAIVEARNNEDNIYGTSNFSACEGEYAEFIAFLYETQYDKERRELTFPWLADPQHTTLILLLQFFQSTTTDDSKTLDELDAEFTDENNGLIGFDYEMKHVNQVFNIESLNNFHNKYVSNFDFEARKVNYKYFKKFYKCGLTRALNQIQQLINENSLHNSLLRIDPALILNEQIHIHFTTNNYALNIDGSWKHGPGNFVIPVQACRELSDFGFLLPLEYYQI